MHSHQSCLEEFIQTPKHPALLGFISSGENNVTWTRVAPPVCRNPTLYKSLVMWFQSDGARWFQKKKRHKKCQALLQIFVHPTPLCCFIGNESHGFWVTLKCTQAFIILGWSCNCYLYIIYHQVYLTIECNFYWCRNRWICLINRVNNKEKNVSINKKWFLYYITSGQ